MAKTGSAASATRLGGRPARSVKSGCTGCGHPFALHRNGTSTCQAFACTSGPDGRPCQGFLGRAYGDEYLPDPGDARLAS
jgi:hypothetical protein